ncbi:MgtC/SapB family protein [Chiayiivirga flava]|uniref:Uncharacterized membrane protein (DUF4010 family) n=1 Tax=Chiayiivirga flava TaxID=659595 RepID=A0A7W8FZT0_9GAMM|nr:DUF4010 domain-containing protein [Chiayiivirga flava]MBB5207534.1 uncharacterized membrane protein (DUF4010 family) [Chiayiivirga flava]
METLEELELPPDLLIGLAVALGIGMLIGLERERRQGREEDRGAAGLRTHALLALSGAVATVLGVWASVVTGVGVLTLTVASYTRSRERDPGLTSEVAILLSFLLGGLALNRPALAAALGVLVAILLSAKGALHRFTHEHMSQNELRDLLLLAAAALIVLPLLPDHAVDPWGALEPASLWKLVVLVMAVGAAGHIALRLVGARWGLPMAGFFSGFASSTAAVAGFGQRARDTDALLVPAVAAALLANLASLLLFAAVIGAASATLLRAAAWPLLAAGLAIAAAGAFGLWKAPRAADALPDEPQARAFRLSHALLFAAIVAAVLLLSAWLREQVGDRGALVAATLVAIAELHAAGASLGQLAGGGLAIADARWGVIALLGASAVAKSVLAFVSGGWRYGAFVALGLMAMLAAAVATAWLVPFEGGAAAA